MNTIEIYRNTSAAIEGEVEGLTDLIGYTGHLTVKKRITSSTVLLDKDHDSVDDLTFTFDLEHEDTDLPRGKYIIEFSISDLTQRYVINQSRLVVKSALKW